MFPTQFDGHGFLIKEDIRNYNVGPSYAWGPCLMSSSWAIQDLWVCLGTLFNVKFLGQNS